jgi:hypothetical protein
MSIVHPVIPVTVVVAVIVIGVVVASVVIGIGRRAETAKDEGQGHGWKQTSSHLVIVPP